MELEILKEAERYGFKVEGLGAHSGRTIMLSDVRTLFNSCPTSSTLDEYAQSIIDDNVLLKNSGASRKEAFLRLKRLYGLDNSIFLFKIFRQLWSQETLTQPVLLMLYAISRDPILRSSVDLVINTLEGGELIAPDFEKEVENSFLDQFTKSTLASIGRNIASSWTQSGHFQGRSKKVRTFVESYPISVAFALFLGYLCGIRGEKLFHTNWVKILDAHVFELHSKSQVASQQGWLEYRQTGNITDITFNHFMNGTDL